MGKKEKIINEKNKEFYKEQEELHHDSQRIAYFNEIDLENETEFYEIQEEEYFTDTVNEIETELKLYCANQAVPLCDKLDVNLDYYVNWVLNGCREITVFKKNVNADIEETILKPIEEVELNLVQLAKDNTQLDVVIAQLKDINYLIAGEIELQMSYDLQLQSGLAARWDNVKTTNEKLVKFSPENLKLSKSFKEDIIKSVGKEEYKNLCMRFGKQLIG